MSWRFTADLAEVPAAAKAWLLADPVRNTVPLTVLARARDGAADGACAGWYTAGGEVCGVALHVPPHPLLVTDLPAQALRPLAAALRDRPVSCLHGPVRQAGELAAALGRPVAERTALRLHRLEELRPPALPGTARPADARDLDTAARWFRAFAAEAEPGLGEDGDPAASARARIDRGELLFWQDGGRPVAMAAFSAPIAGMSRIGMVYTPPELRGKGYGSAVAYAATRAAQAVGADRVLLFTDLADPVSNAIYHALGYRPVADYVSLVLARPVPDAG